MGNADKGEENLHDRPCVMWEMACTSCGRVCRQFLHLWVEILKCLYHKITGKVDTHLLEHSLPLHLILTATKSLIGFSMKPTNSAFLILVGITSKFQSENSVKWPFISLIISKIINFKNSSDSTSSISCSWLLTWLSSLRWWLSIAFLMNNS